MKKCIKKILVCAIAITVALSSAEPSMVKASDGFDGDITDNPWGDIFEDKDNPGDLPVGGGDSNGNNDSSKDDLNMNGLNKKRAAEIARFKKALTTKVIKATKKNKKVKRATIVLRKNKKAKGYQIQYSTGRKFKKSKTKTKTVTKTKCILKKLKAGKKYYVRARAYGKRYGTKVYGKWTKKQIVRIIKSNI